MWQFSGFWCSPEAVTTSTGLGSLPATLSSLEHPLGIAIVNAVISLTFHDHCPPRLFAMLVTNCEQLQFNVENVVAQSIVLGEHSRQSTVKDSDISALMFPSDVLNV